MRRATEKIRPFCTRCLWYFAIVLFCNAAYSQQGRAVDTAGVKQLLKGGDALHSGQPEKSLALYMQALDASRQINFPHGAVLSLIKLGYWYFGNNIDKAIAYGQEAQQQLTRNSLMQQHKTQADIYLLLAEAYDVKGKKDSAAYFFYELNDELQTNKINVPNFEIDVYIKLMAFWLNMDYDNAHLEQTAHQCLQKAKLAFLRSSDTSALAASKLYFVQGLYYYALKKYDSSRSYFRQYLVKQRDKISVPRKISAYMNIAETYLLENNPEPALTCIHQIKELANDSAKKESLAFYLVLADLLKVKGLYQQKKYQEAIDLADVSFKKNEATGEPIRGEVIEAHKIVAECYKALGEYEKAYQHANLYLQLHDSITQKDKLDMVNQIDIRYRISEKDHALAIQKLAIEETNSTIHKRNVLMLSFGFSALFLAALFFLLRKNALQKQKLSEELINGFDQQMEITRLNASIQGEERERIRIARELHDGIGGLLAIATIHFEQSKKGLVTTESPIFLDGLNLLKEASAELRKTAHNIMPEILMQKGLVAGIHTFCERMAGNNATAIIFELTGVPKKYNAGFELLLYRITQELLHNVLKHSKATEAFVQLSFHDDGVDLTVEDNGIGMPTEKGQAGIGLSNIQDRIKAVNGQLHIKSDSAGTSVYLEFHEVQGLVEESAS